MKKCFVAAAALALALAFAFPQNACAETDDLADLFGDETESAPAKSVPAKKSSQKASSAKPVAVPAKSATSAAQSAVPAQTAKPQWNVLFPKGLTKAGQRAGAATLKNLSRLDGKFVFIYYSASWCGPCRRFTPQLVDFYKKNSDIAEVVLIGGDLTEDAMIAYCKSERMKWLAVPFGLKEISTPEEAGLVGLKLILSGLPTLYVFAPDGKYFTRLSGAGAEKTDSRLDELKLQMVDWFGENQVKIDPKHAEDVKRLEAVIEKKKAAAEKLSAKQQK